LPLDSQDDPQRSLFLLAGLKLWRTDACCLQGAIPASHRPLQLAGDFRGRIVRGTIPTKVKIV